MFSVVNSVLAIALRDRRGVPPRPSRPRRTQHRLTLESLEGRELLSTSFAPAVTSPVGLRPQSIVVADLTSDGKQDLAVLNQGQLPDRTSSVSILRGIGDGRFQPAITTNLLAGTTSLAAGDFNRDGRLDIAVTNGLDSTVEVLLGNGDGTFQDNPLVISVGTQGTFLPSSQAVAVGDFQHDGNLGLAVVNPGSNSVSVLLGNGDGTFKPRVDIPVGAEPVSVVAADLGNGRIDLVVANRRSSDVSVLVGNGDGSFQPAQTIDVKIRAFGLDSQPFALRAGDFDGNGRPDILISQFVGFDVGESFATVLPGNGDGTFRAPIHTDVGFDAFGLAVADFNGDRKLDFAAADNGFVPGAGDVFLGNGDGTFGSPTFFPTDAGSALSAAAGDFNRDGRPDLVVVNTFGDGVSVLLNTTPPNVARVDGVTVNDGSSQRSRVTSVRVAFDRHVTLPASPDAAFALIRQGDGQAVKTNASVDDSGSGTVVTLSFVGGAIDGPGGPFRAPFSLADGRYTLTILAALIDGGNFDGNGDGTAGDDFVLTGDPAGAAKLFRLFGDGDGDGDVDAADFAAFRTAFGGTQNLAFDFNNDGVVLASDFAAFRARFGLHVGIAATAENDDEVPRRPPASSVTPPIGDPVDLVPA